MPGSHTGLGITYTWRTHINMQRHAHRHTHTEMHRDTHTDTLTYAHTQTPHLDILFQSKVFWRKVTGESEALTAGEAVL